MTSQLVVSSFVTLDGYMVGPDEDMSWVIEGFDAEMANDIAEYMNSVSCYVLGRLTYEIFAGYWPNAVPYAPGDELDPAGGKEDPRIIRSLNDAPKVVFSKTLEAPSWSGTRVVRDGLEDEIRKLKQEPGKIIDVQGSASVVQALERADLIDEYRLYLHPVLLGNGKPLFAAGASRQDFERADVKPYPNGAMRLTYRRRHRAS